MSMLPRTDYMAVGLGRLADNWIRRGREVRSKHNPAQQAYIIPACRCSQRMYMVISVTSSDVTPSIRGMSPKPQ